MRTPTPLETLLRWHAAALEGKASDPITHEPRAGWFKRKLRRGCCWVPVKIWVRQETGDDGELLSDERFMAEVDGKGADAAEQWMAACENPISEREFNYLTRLRAWQRVNAPEEWDPYTPVDHTRTPIIEEN